MDLKENTYEFHLKVFFNMKCFEKMSQLLFFFLLFHVWISNTSDSNSSSQETEPALIYFLPLFHEGLFVSLKIKCWLGIYYKNFSNSLLN